MKQIVCSSRWALQEGEGCLRLEDNLFMLVYCLRSAEKMKHLVVTAIDFAKAFDSVNRKCLIETLAYYKCDPRITDIVALWHHYTLVMRQKLM